MRTERQISETTLSDISTILSELSKDTEISLHINPNYLDTLNLTQELRTIPERANRFLELIRFSDPNPEITYLNTRDTTSYDIYLDNKIALTLTYKIQ
ncbi:hypothetical protein K8R33_04935 [archaeon]|nr:hypothetical protein [archaeon]